MQIFLIITDMSKDKGSKNVKKLPNVVGKKAPSDYQSGKGSASSEIISTVGKKKK
jgi:hypothetical protein